MKTCILIPIYNNKDTIETVADDLLPYGLPILIVDDGSDQPTRKVLDRLAAREGVEVVHLALNGGKGQAVKYGFRHAHELGFTHALQLDADGQHHSGDIERFLAASRANPQALILGTPVFGEDVPKARLHGRKLSRWLVWLETLSYAIADPLFGFRVYPLAPAIRILDTAFVGNRMDFDPEIAVRLVWLGCPVVNLPSPVRYPENGLSSFRMVRDNIRISFMHTRLVIGMLCRSPLIVWRRVRS